MKRVVTIQDISCFGKCSLTVALPIISAMGVETAVIPTAVLSTHTGGFTGYTFRDLTKDIIPIAEHWKKLDIKFDAIQTGYLGSVEQVKLMSMFFDMFSTAENNIIVDPVMGDKGVLYAGFEDRFISEMRTLCGKADIIMPNLTETSFILDIPYTESYDEDFIKDCLKKLTDLGANTAIITGVQYNDGLHGAVAYSKDTDTYSSCFKNHIDRYIHGTGDIFSSTFTGAIAKGSIIQEALDIAVNFTVDCIDATTLDESCQTYSVCFEKCLGKLAD